MLLFCLFCLFSELLQACGQIWRPAQQVIRVKVNPRCFVVAENTRNVPLAPMSCRIRAHALVPVVGGSDYVRRPGEPLSTHDSEGVEGRSLQSVVATRCRNFFEWWHLLCPAPRQEHVMSEVVNVVPLPVVWT
jgi:hypothetical protein